MTRKMGLPTGDVVERWIDGHEAGTPAAGVPGGRRVESISNPDTSVDLFSYRTVVARRLGYGAVALTPRRYSVTTSKLMGRVRRALQARGFHPSPGSVVTVEAAVPGRWGGYGPAWHPTGREALPFEVWLR